MTDTPTRPIEVWQKGRQRIEVMVRCASLIWWRKDADDVRLRWTRLSKFHLWRHGAERRRR